MDEKEKMALELINIIRHFKQHKHYMPKDTSKECLSPAQLTFLHIFWGETKKHPEGVKVSHMGKIMNVTSSSITQLINSLEENDFITKTINKKDRRSIYIKLSKNGDLFLKNHQAHMLEHLTGLIDYIGVEKMESFVETLKDIIIYTSEERSH